MKRVIPLLLPILLLLSLTAILPATNSKGGKDIFIPEGESRERNIVSFGGNVVVNGTAEGTILLIGGQLRLKGKVGKDVICIGTDVTVSDGTAIDGDLIAVGGSLKLAEKTTIKGEYLFFKFDLKKIESTLLPLFTNRFTIDFLKTLKIVIWFIIALLVLVVFPLKVTEGIELLEESFLKVGLIGAISFFGLFFLLFVFILMSFILIGIPLLLVLILFYFAIFIFGRTVLLYFIGMKISRILHFEKISPAFFILFGILVYALLKFIPVIGVLLLLIMNLLEIGVGIGYLFRKKIFHSG